LRLVAVSAMAIMCHLPFSKHISFNKTLILHNKKHFLSKYNSLPLLDADSAMEIVHFMVPQFIFEARFG